MNKKNMRDDMDRMLNTAMVGRTYFISSKTSFEKIGLLKEEDLQAYAEAGEDMSPSISAPVRFVWEELMCRSDLTVRLAQMYKLLEDNGIEVPVEWPQVTVEGFDELADESARIVLEQDFESEIKKSGGNISRSFTASNGLRAKVYVADVGHTGKGNTGCDHNCNSCGTTGGSCKDPDHILNELQKMDPAAIGDALQLIGSLSDAQISSLLDKALVKAHEDISRISDRNLEQQRMLDQLAAINGNKVKATYGGKVVPQDPFVGMPESLRKLFSELPGLNLSEITPTAPQPRRFTDRG